MKLKEVLAFINSDACTLPLAKTAVARRVIDFYGVDADSDEVSLEEVCSGSSAKASSIQQYHSVWRSVLRNGFPEIKVPHAFKLRNYIAKASPVETLIIPIPLRDRERIVRVEIPRDFTHEDAEKVEKILMAYAK